jgi:hypothetical protein
MIYDRDMSYDWGGGGCIDNSDKRWFNCGQAGGFTICSMFINFISIS